MVIVSVILPFFHPQTEIPRRVPRRLTRRGGTSSDPVMHSGALQRYWDENACYERMQEGGHIARRVTKRLVAAAARAMDAFVRADWHTVRETVQELRGQGEFLAGLLAEHQSLLRRQDTCGEHVATAWKELQETVRGAEASLMVLVPFLNGTRSRHSATRSRRSRWRCELLHRERRLPTRRTLGT